MWRHQGSNRQWISIMWPGLLLAELEWEPRSMGFWLAKSMMHAWFYCTMKANIFPLGDGWEYGSDIAGVGIPSNSLLCQGLTPSVTLPPSASAAQHTNMLEVFSFPRQKNKPFQKCDMLLIREEGQNKWKRINYERKRKEFFSLQ